MNLESIPSKKTPMSNSGPSYPRLPCIKSSLSSGTSEVFSSKRPLRRCQWRRGWPLKDASEWSKMECAGPASNPSHKVTANQPPTSKHLPNTSGNVHNANGCKGRCQQIACSWNSHHGNLSLAALVVSSKNHLCKRTETTGAAVLERCLQRKTTLLMEVHTMLSGQCKGEWHAMFTTSVKSPKSWPTQQR